MKRRVFGPMHRMKLAEVFLSAQVRIDDLIFGHSIDFFLENHFPLNDIRIVGSNLFVIFR